MPSSDALAMLVLSGSNDRAVYAICRVARRLGLELHIVASGAQDHILCGAYRDQVCHVRSDRTLDAHRLAEWAVLARRRSATPDASLVVLPSSEFLNRFLLVQDKAGVLRELRLILPLVDQALYARLSDKDSASDWAHSLGLRVPRRLPGFGAEHLPLVAKPRSNIGPDGRVMYPQLIRSEDERQAFLAGEDSGHYFAQEMVEGNSRYLLGCLARDGRAWLHAQRNLAQQPAGKSMLLACSDDLHHSVLGQQVVAGLRSAGFFGLFMIEFKGPREQPAFIEINPRPWGPLQLCVDAGSGVVEAFLGDWLCGDPDRFAPAPQAARRAHYLWSGGAFETWRAGGHIRWHGRGGVGRWLQLLRALPHDVYLRADSWRVFWRELRGHPAH